VQDLIALGYRVELARRALERDSKEAARRLDELRELIHEMVAEVRRFTRALRPIYLEDLGLLPALEMLVRDVASKAGVEAAFHVSGSPRRLSEELELTVYRIAQEALNNVEQHARARQVNLSLHFNLEEVLLEVADDGVGFEVPEHPEELARKGHFGLLGMRERAALVGGRLELRATPGQGTRLRVHLPIRGAPAGGGKHPLTKL
jgi:signal transduction histidine kinase